MHQLILGREWLDYFNWGLGSFPSSPLITSPLHPFVHPSLLKRTLWQPAEVRRSAVSALGVSTYYASSRHTDVQRVVIWDTCIHSRVVFTGTSPHYPWSQPVDLGTNSLGLIPFLPPVPPAVTSRLPSPFLSFPPSHPSARNFGTCGHRASSAAAGGRCLRLLVEESRSLSCLDRDERGAVERDDVEQRLERGGTTGLEVQPGGSHGVDRRRVDRPTSTLQQPRRHGSAHRAPARLGNFAGSCSISNKTDSEWSILC